MSLLDGRAAPGYARTSMPRSDPDPQPATGSVRIAIAAGCRRHSLVTTNDNVDGLRFYQRQGFHFAKLHEGAVDRSRELLKPEIPEIGDHGIPLRDELELRKEL